MSQYVTSTILYHLLKVLELLRQPLVCEMICEDFNSFFSQ